MQEIILKIKYFERGLSQSLKKVNFIFSFLLKITSANLCKPIHDIINNSKKKRKEGTKLQKFNYLENEKNLS